jgi:hypothetical protein
VAEKFGFTHTVEQDAMVKLLNQTVQLYVRAPFRVMDWTVMR